MPEKDDFDDEDMPDIPSPMSLSAPTDGPRAEALISPTRLKAWLKRMEVSICVYLFSFSVFHSFCARLAFQLIQILAYYVILR